MSTRTRWIIRSDIQAISRIEADSKEDPWTFSELKEWYYMPDSYGVITTDNLGPLGYLLAIKRKTYLDVLKWYVVGCMRRRGVGRNLFTHLAQSPELLGVKSVTLVVPDTNMDVHKFLKKVGFKAVRVINYREGPDDYLFSWWPPEEKENGEK